MKKLIEVVPALSGFVVGIGVRDEKVLDAIDQRSAITGFDLLNQESFERDSKKKKKQKKLRRIHIKKLHKVYRPKSVDYMICNSDEIGRSLRFFIRESIRLTKGKVYCYGNLEKYEAEDMVTRYRRYDVEISLEEENGTYFLTVDTGKARYHFFRDKWYMVVDGVMNIIDLLGNGLLN